METQYEKPAVGEHLGAKRRASSDEWTASKKRALSSRSGSPVGANGATQGRNKSMSGNESGADEPEKEDDIELFRKGAIFRRMRHYQRECSRAHGRIRQLEDAARLANLERIEAESCWTNTMGLIRRLTQLDALKVDIDDDLKICFPSRVFSSDDFRKTKSSSESKVQAAEKAIIAFIKLAGKAEQPRVETLLSECQDLQKSNSFLTAEAERTYSLLEETRRERDRLLEELQVAHTKIDRLQSPILNPATGQGPEMQVAVKVNGDVKKEEEQNSLVAKEDSPSVVPSPKATDECRVQFLEALVSSRDEALESMEKEYVSLRRQLTVKTIELDGDAIARSDPYQALMQHASKLEALLREERQQMAVAMDEISKLRRIKSTWHEQMESHQKLHVEELKLLLKKRDDDLNRIRQHREQLETQQKELKATHESRRLSLIKYKELAESRGERIELLSSEVKRLKTRLAAAAGDEDLLSFLLDDANADSDYVEDVKRRLSSSETELSSLRATLKGEERHLIDVASLQAKLESATREIETFRSTGADALPEQLRAKDEELRILRLKETQTSQEMNELFSEMDRLSKAWEAVDKQAHAQAISVDKWEEEREKLILAKQKSDNKYFKAMSESEVKDAERKQTLRHMEWQAKQIEVHEKNEKEFLALNDSLSAELSDARLELRIQRDSLESLKRSTEIFTQKCEDDAHRIRLLLEEIQKRDKEVAESKISEVKLKEEILKATKEAGKAIQKAKALTTSAAPASEREGELQEEIAKLMNLLRCSTCHQNFRSTVITKCMHTFCKPCVDARISHRQRKCPACNLAFSQTDVQTFYFQ